jgi:hypothetical protein
MKFAAVNFVHNFKLHGVDNPIYILTTVRPVCLCRSVGLLLDHNHYSSTTAVAAFTGRAASDQLCWAQ